MADRNLRCPACDATMDQVERRSVLIDICRDCRGVYLDRGELDKLLEAAAPALDVEPRTTPDEPRVDRDFDRGRDRDSWSDERDREWSDRRDSDWDHKRRRRRGFLDDIFDFD